MSKYKSVCGYTTDEKHKLIRHINSHKCTDFKTLGIELKKRENLDHLTDIEKLTRRKQQLKSYKIKNKEHNKKQQHEYDLKKGFLGAQTELQFAGQILKHMKCHSKTRNHEIPDYWSVDKVLKLLCDNKVYKIKTNIGLFEFPMMITNGFHNSASIDRIDNTKGYTIENIEIRPTFLNSPRKLTTDNIRQIPILRTTRREINELENIIKILETKILSHHFFYQNSRHKKTLKKRNLNFDFETIEEFVKFLIDQYIEQGGRCYYSNIPISLLHNDNYTTSIERKNPSKSYSKENVVLIVVGLNYGIRGQFLNQYLSDEERFNALNAAIFNQEYWDNCTLVDSEESIKIKDAIEYDRNFMRTKIAK